MCCGHGLWINETRKKAKRNDMSVLDDNGVYSEFKDMLLQCSFV